MYYKGILGFAASSITSSLPILFDLFTSQPIPKKLDQYNSFQFQNIFIHFDEVQQDR